MCGRWPRLDRLVWPGVTAKTLASVKRPDAGSLCDRTLAGCVRSVLTYVDVGHTEETLCDRTLAVSGQALPDASGREKSCLEPYWKRPDAKVQRPITF